MSALEPTRLNGTPSTAKMSAGSVVWSVRLISGTYSLRECHIFDMPAEHIIMNALCPFVETPMAYSSVYVRRPFQFFFSDRISRANLTARVCMRVNAKANRSSRRRSSARQRTLLLLRLCQIIRALEHNFEERQRFYQLSKTTRAFEHNFAGRRGSSHDNSDTVGNTTYCSVVAAARGRCYNRRFHERQQSFLGYTTTHLLCTKKSKFSVTNQLNKCWVLL